MNFADRLVEAIDRKGTPAIVGIDPRYEMLPAGLRTDAAPDRAHAAQSLLKFAMGVIDAVAPLVPAVKPNSAFFEAYGADGWLALEETVAYAQSRGLLVIVDAKRGDIGSTAEAYARALFDEIGADAITLSPYLGEDSLSPFFAYAKHGKGFFLLVKTSNPGSADVQDESSGEGRVYERVADRVRAWGEAMLGESGFSSVGAVVGATFPDQAAALRKRMPSTPFLLPGYGVQGGKGETLANAFAENGRGAIVSSSRGVTFAYREAPYDKEFGDVRWTEAVRRAALAMREDLARALPGASWNRPGA